MKNVEAYFVTNFLAVPLQKLRDGQLVMRDITSPTASINLFYHTEQATVRTLPPCAQLATVDLLLCFLVPTYPKNHLLSSFFNLPSQLHGRIVYCRLFYYMKRRAEKTLINATGVCDGSGGDDSVVAAH